MSSELTASTSLTADPHEVAPAPMEVLIEHPHRRRLPVVVDANAVLEDLVHYARRHRSLLSTLAAGRVIVLLTAEHIPDKVEEHLPRVAPDTGLDPASLSEAWQRHYLPHLRLVALPAIDSSEDERVAAVTDAEDVPVGQLAVLLAPSLLLTRDKHLRRVGLGEAQWADALNLVRQLVALDTQLYGGTQSLALLTRVLLVAAGEGVKAIGRSPVAAGLALALGVSLATEWRPAAGAFMQRARPQLARATSTAAQRVSDTFALRAATAARVDATLVEPSTAPSVAAAAARALARRDEILPAATIAQHIARSGTPVDDGHLRLVLREHPAFELQPGRGWQLGHPRA